MGDRSHNRSPLMHGSRQIRLSAAAQGLRRPDSARRTFPGNQTQDAVQGSFMPRASKIRALTIREPIGARGAGREIGHDKDICLRASRRTGGRIPRGIANDEFEPRWRAAVGNRAGYARTDLDFRQSDSAPRLERQAARGTRDVGRWRTRAVFLRPRGSQPPGARPVFAGGGRGSVSRFE